MDIKKMTWHILLSCQIIIPIELYIYMVKILWMYLDTRWNTSYDNADTIYLYNLDFWHIVNTYLVVIIIKNF